MILTPEERRALLGLISLLLLGQGVALVRDQRKARPDRELSAWLTRAQAARAESLGTEADLSSAFAPVLPGTRLGVVRDGNSVTNEPVDGNSESVFEGVVAESVATRPGLAGLPPVRIESSSRVPAGVAATGRIAINRASAGDLEALPGIGPALARRIVEEREKSGPFRSPRDLLRVKGIGPKKQAAIQDRIDWSP
jgi:competence ComEA-like helix-hairpin-helix protein